LSPPNTVRPYPVRCALALVWLLAGLLLIAPVSAQSAAEPFTRDPEALAQRLLGWDGARPLPDLPRLYEAGTTESFWIAKIDRALPTQVTATLAGSSSNIYVWVEDGIDYAPESMQQLAQGLDQLVSALRWRGAYRPNTLLAGTNGQVLDPSNLYPLPDVDSDPHLYVLFAADLPEDRDAIVNPVDSLPAYLQPGGFGNERELIVVNTSPYVGADLTSDVFITPILRGVFNLIFDTSFPDQPAWHREGLGWFLLARFQQTVVGADQAANYLLATQTPLLRPASLTTRPQTLGAQLLFLSYLTQRFGERTVLDLFSAEGDGMEPLNVTLAALDITDPLTGATVTADEAFADFVMTNGLNGAFGDGRFVHRVAQLDRGQAAIAITLETLPQTLIGFAGPYSAHYYEYQANQAETVELTLAHSETVERLNLSNSDDPANRFYWSGRASNRDHTLTRGFDLTGVETATLTYDVWYELADAWNYGYVEVSSDGGATWQVVHARHSSDVNRYGAAYGPGYTGISNPEGPRPFPVIGIQVANDGITIFAVEPGSPGDEAGLRAGDVIAGYDGGPWPGAPNLLGLLGQYAPGDRLNFWIQRGRTQIDVPVVLGASPTRVVQPEPRWLEEQIDLSAYAGQDLLIRFEYISLPSRWSEGFAVDNIAIPEIDYRDNAEGESDWELAGWEVVDNQLPARFLIQVATFGAQGQPPRVRRLLSPTDAPGGGWRVPLAEGERLLLAVSGMNADTFQAAPFEIDIREVE